jgi:putative NADPH-quinone reductase
MPIGAIVSTIGKAVGKLAPAALDILGRRQQNQAQRAEARRAEAFAERMSNTQVQRRKADLEAAGFNPALAFGDSASSPGGIQAQIGGELGGAVSSAQAAAMNRAQLDLVRKQMDIATQQGIKAKAEAEVAGFDAQKRSLEQRVWNAVATGQGVDLSTPLAKSIASQFEATAMSPESISASNSALAAQARAANTSSSIQEFERRFLEQMQTGKGNVSKILNMIVPLLRMLK